MYPNEYALQHPERPAVIMANTGEQITYRMFEARANQLAHCLRDRGLQPLDHYAIFMENNAAYLETCAAGERTGLYYTCVNAYLQADELAYILQNSEAKLLITSTAKLAVAREALRQAPAVTCVLVVGGEDESSLFYAYESMLGEYPTEPVADELVWALTMSILFNLIL